MSAVDRILDGAPAFRLELEDSAVIVSRNHLATKLRNPEARGDWRSATPIRGMIHGSNYKLNLTPHEPSPLPK